MAVKRCKKCNYLLNQNHSSSLCLNCEDYERRIQSKELNFHISTFKSDTRSCPTCGAGISMKNGFGECSFCGDEISSSGFSSYLGYIGTE